MPDHDPKQSVLVVDDDHLNARILGVALQSHCKLIFATNGPEALEKAVVSPHPDLIMLDILLPGMDGFEIFKKLKEDEKTKDIPVIFISAMIESGDEVRCLEMGAFDFITKPFTLALVLARVKNALELKKHREFIEFMRQSYPAEFKDAEEAFNKRFQP